MRQQVVALLNARRSQNFLSAMVYVSGYLNISDFEKNRK